jgi:rhodanese-related sulfurtransferase
MSSSSLPSVDPGTLQAWLEKGEAMLIDVREPDEHARERIAGTRLAPLSRFDPEGLAAEPGKILVFHCNSGNRTTQAAGRLLRAGEREVYQLAGGLQAWKRAGLPVIGDRKAPLPIMRQVQNAAGSLVLLGIVLAVLVSPWFMALSAFVGAGLIIAGITGFCGMANLLMHMPWNRSRGAQEPWSTSRARCSSASITPWHGSTRKPPAAPPRRRSRPRQPARIKVA